MDLPIVTHDIEYAETYLAAKCFITATPIE